jgi:hypothetical protein
MLALQQLQRPAKTGALIQGKLRRMGARLRFAACILALFACAPALGQTRPSPPPAPAADEDEATHELVVTAKRGAVVGDIQPQITLSPTDIQSYGVSTLTELIDELAPQTRSSRGSGPPVILLGGRRISSFFEIRDIPTEAIQRVEVLPEEVALKYGYSADQRVVNIVLRRSFRAWTAEATGGAPTEGGQALGQGEIDVLRLQDGRRFNLDLKVQGSSAITEDERDLIPTSAGQPFDPLGNVVGSTPGGEIDPALSALVGRPVVIAGVPAAAGTRPLTLADFASTAGEPNRTDDGRYRTLAGSSSQASGNLVYARPVLGKFNATVNASFSANRGESLQGLPTVGLDVPSGNPFSPFTTPVVVDRSLTGFGPLRQETRGWSAHLGSTVDRDIKRWRLSLTAAYDHAWSQTLTDTGVDPSAVQARIDAGDPALDPFAPLDPLFPAQQPQARAVSRTDALDVRFVANGPVFRAPAGDASATFQIGDNQSWYGSSSERLGRSLAVDLSRNDFGGRVNLDLPLTSRRANVLAVLGELTANGNAAFDRLSDFGDLFAYGYGVNWTVRDWLSLIVSHTRDQTAPSFQQRGGPIVVTPGVPTFDFLTGRTVNVQSITGGNPALVSNTRDVDKIGLNLQPLPKADLSVSADYVRTHVRNPIQTFPAVTAEIEAAFPERFLRDDAGQLTAVDYRPINFTAQDTSELRWGINYSRPLGRQPPQRPPGGPRGPGGPGGPRPGGPPPGGGGGFGGFGGGRGAPGRLQFAVYHTVHFQDRFLARPGGPVFDLLNGYPAGSSGGQPRHEVEVQVGALWRGLGARVSGDWQSSSFVRGSGAPSGDLHFAPIGKLNLRLFADLGQQRALIAKHPWLRGARLNLSVSNLFDAKEHVRDGSGLTPLTYQPDYLDPQGRVIRLSFRKLFL